MSDDIAFQTLLRDYAEPVADDGFTAATLKRAQRTARLRRRVLISAATLGGILALSRMPGLWNMMSDVTIPTIDPIWLTGFVISGFVVWAALDRDWTDTV